MAGGGPGGAGGPGMASETRDSTCTDIRTECVCGGGGSCIYDCAR